MMEAITMPEGMDFEPQKDLTAAELENLPLSLDELGLLLGTSPDDGRLVFVARRLAYECAHESLTQELVPLRASELFVKCGYSRKVQRAFCTYRLRPHAVQRYRERVDNTLDEQQALMHMRRLLLLGKQVNHAPSWVHGALLTSGLSYILSGPDLAFAIDTHKVVRTVLVRQLGGIYSQG